MKKLNKKGFTLIELLAVIVIMGILMVVAIPAVSQMIDNARKDTFINTAKSYVNAVNTLWAADEIKCGASGSELSASSLDAGTYYFPIDTRSTSTYDSPLQEGGKSSWGETDVVGYIEITLGTDAKTTSKIILTDNVHGIGTATALKSLTRSSVKLNSQTYPDLSSLAADKICSVK